MRYYLYNMWELRFEAASQKFRLIDDDIVSVVVNWNDSLSYIGHLKR